MPAAALIALIGGLILPPGHVILWEVRSHLPPVSLDELDRFPPRAVATENRIFSRQYEQWLELHRGLCPGRYCPDLEEAISETSRLYAIWDALEDALTEWRLDRLERLETLRDLLGAEDYYAGQMPPPVPLRFYRTIGD